MSIINKGIKKGNKGKDKKEIRKGIRNRKEKQINRK